MGDTISRAAVIDALEKVAELFPWRVPGNRDSYDRYNEAWNDSIGRAEIEIEKLPSAQPTAEWLECKVIDDVNIDEWQSAKCSACGLYHTTPYMYYFSNYKFCPNCGARMHHERTDHSR